MKTIDSGRCCMFGHDNKLQYYRDDNDSSYTTYKCAQVAEDGSPFCCFHDADRSKFLSSYLIQRFNNFLTTAISNADLIECVGFYLSQQEVKSLVEKKLKRR
jgi:hypothetical protein